MYTIGQIAKMTGLPISTLRYYDREGLFPNMARESGIRKFSEADLENISVIECLKKSGWPIKKIKEYVILFSQGKETYMQRKQLLEEQKRLLEAEIDQMKKTLAMLEYKCWYYDQAIANDGEESIRALLPDQLPGEIQALYDLAYDR